MTFMDFEKPLEALYEQLEKLKEVGEKGELDVSEMLHELENKITAKRKEIYANLSGWQKVQLSRHPERPYTLYYINTMCQKFVELHGDRYAGDDHAIVGGLASLDGQTVMIIGQQKGVNTKMRQYRNFGMANPEGYRKALRLMKMAERFGFPVVTLIDTPGAFPGLEAEQRGQAEAIARNLFEMAQLRVPILCYIIGEGASGGALGIGLGDKVFMLEHTWYSVISPENCSTILWHSWDYKEQAAEALKLDAENMLHFGLIDGIVKEPLGGGHNAPEEMANTLKNHIKTELAKIIDQDPDERIMTRIEKYSKMGHYARAEPVVEEPVSGKRKKA
ncbi:MAG: acetyl-CoA carboxylase carboxyltransferase subunit alpha [Saprospiraceae bacterium]|nr:acetyl-CoA carboxylase carboxyltransferase subunit alpha [Saprospiraceae bacterium]